MRMTPGGGVAMNRKRKRVDPGTVCASAALLLLVGCATPTPYQVREGGQGYYDREVLPGVYDVSFEANRKTPRWVVMEHWYRRAAEICGGPDRYEILGLNTSGENVVVNTPTLLDVYNLPAVEGRIRCVK
jgi:hypothetical protein